MTEPTYTSIARDGLWTNNPGLVQLLGLCPLLATSNNLINGLGLGLATALALAASNLCVSLIRRVVRPEIRIPVFVLVIAAIVTVIELGMNAYLHDLYLVLGIFIPLIVTNCNLIGRAEAFASKNTPGRALLDGVMMGLGFTLVLVTLGGLREIIGNGTLLAQAHMMFGEGARGWTLHLIDDYRGFLLAILPPGAFIGLGLIIALKNIIDARLQRRAQRIAVAEPVAAAG
ncbi:MAG TPA: electron transport complex subunit E [Gammaproteobacteria bacterium]